jgi:threonine/homoserine/homoserine lactone efflux protein
VLTVAPGQVAAYAGALAVLVLTPGPVVAALIARAATGGVAAAVPLAAGVAVGDLLWPLLAMLGLAALTAVWTGLLAALRLVGAAILIWMGLDLVRKARAAAASAAAGAGARERRLAGFAAGLAVIAGNPKAILFYLGILPGFFDLARLTEADVLLICLVSASVPFLGNLAWAALFSRARTWLADPVAMRRTHVAAGLALVAVGVGVALG